MQEEHDLDNIDCNKDFVKRIPQLQALSVNFQKISCHLPLVFQHYCQWANDSPRLVQQNFKLYKKMVKTMFFNENCVKL